MITTDTKTANRSWTAWQQTSTQALVPLAAKPKQAVPTLGVQLAKKQFLKLAKQWIQKRRQDKVDAVNVELKDRDDIRNCLNVSEFFSNAPAAATLHVFNSQDPIANLKKPVAELADRFKLIEVAIGQHLDGSDDDAEGAPLPADNLADIIHHFATSGVMIHAMGPVRHGTFQELVTRQLERSLLGNSPGRDAIMGFPQRTCEVSKDPMHVTGHHPIGAALGARLTIDLRDSMGQPMAGDRDKGYGPVGRLKCGALIDTYTHEQRSELTRYGLNVMRDWPKVGSVVIVSNRSLQDGDGIYIYGSTTRSRQQVQAIFHETAERDIQNEGKRDAGPLEKTMGSMNTYLNNLKKEGWITEGSVQVDYTAIIVSINVHFVPARPIDNITLVYSAQPYNDKH